jgi:hypothetical protein
MLRNYKNSKKRLILLLAQLLIIMYTLFNGDETARLLTCFLIPLWIKTATTWRSEC